MSAPWSRIARLMKVCRRNGRSPEDAEDLIQEAFLRLHEYCLTTEVVNEEAFLARTVFNLSVTKYRRDRFVAYVGQSVEELEPGIDLSEGMPGPERIVSAQQRLNQISSALGSVSERTREIFLAHRAGYSYEEIATDLKISHRTVQKHIARAMFILLNMPRNQEEESQA